MNQIKEKEKDPKGVDPKDPKAQKKKGFKSGKTHGKRDHWLKDPKFRKTENDPEFYWQYPDLAENAGHVAFNRRAGGLLPFHVGGVNVTKNIDPILAYLWIPTPGESSDGNSAINITSKSAWKMLNRRFRGVSKYQQSDFGIIQFCILDAVVSLAEAERIYGILNYYSLNNLAVPNTLLLSLGIDPYTFTDLADFRVRLNRIIISAQTLCLVKGYKLLDHYLLLANNVFKDRESERAQLFSFVKAGYWLYDPTLPTGTGARFVQYTKSSVIRTTPGTPSTNRYALRTADNILDDLLHQFNTLLNDDDVDNVCSDILAFYGNKEDAAEIVRLAPVPEDYVVRAVFSDSICRQVHNAIIPRPYTQRIQNGVPQDTELPYIGSVIPTSFTAYATYQPLMIYQEHNDIIFNMNMWHNTGTEISITSGSYMYMASASSAQSYVSVKPAVDTDILSPTSKDVFEMTRLTSLGSMVTVNSGGSNYYYVQERAFSSVFILGAYMILFEQGFVTAHNAVSETYTKYEVIPSNMLMLDVTSYVTSIDGVMYLSKFDWAPLQYATYMAYTSIVGDTTNIVSMDEAILKPIHDIALLSEFKNPVVDLILKEN